MTKRDEIYAQVTERFVAALEAGVVPWRQTWALTRDHNPVTGTRYQGINILLLALAKMDAAKVGQEFGPLWSTFNGWKKLGGSVNRGEHGSLVVFWDVSERETGEIGPNGEPVKEPRFLLRTYTVFNLAQTAGVTLPKGYERREELGEIDGEAIAADVIAGIVDGPTETSADAPWYRPGADLVGMPERAAFDGPAEYWASRFHEYVHATGHARRLNRPGIAEAASFGSDRYSREELVAEIGAGFMLARCGLLEATFENNAGYIGGWLERIKGDASLVVKAAAEAEKAAAWLLGEVNGAARAA